MAGVIRPGEPLPDEYVGLDEFFEFTNWDGKWTPFNCGQAAACTLLHYEESLDPAAEPAELMRTIEKAHPPDNLGGWFGTSRYCVERICRAHGVKLREIRGEDAFREQLTAGRPVIVMLGVPGKKLWKWHLPAGHWMVAYGFDGEYVYLSNKGRMTWDEFRRGWHGLVPRLIRMNGRGLVPGADSSPKV